MIKFYNISASTPIERVKIKFNLTKAVTVIRTPVILSFEITIRKLQSLRLDHIIVDTGNNVWEDSMMYVELSRVRTRLMNYDPSKTNTSKFSLWKLTV